MKAAICNIPRFLDSCWSSNLASMRRLSTHFVPDNPLELRLSIGPADFRTVTNHVFRSSYRIPGHWPSFANWGKPSPQALPYENLCGQHRGCKVSFLVLLDEVAKGQEGKWRDRQLERCRYIQVVEEGTLLIHDNQISEKRPLKVKNFGIWIRYDSRSGTHNMYKEYREMSRTDAVEAMYQDMAARHRSRFRSIHVRSSTFADQKNMLTITSDPQGCWAREDRRREAPLHQATPHQGPQIPSSSPRIQGRRHQVVRRKATINLLLNGRIGILGSGWNSLVLRCILGCFLAFARCEPDNEMANA